MKDISTVVSDYREHLLLSKSPLTVKNYISDIWHFVSWFANYYERPFSVDLLSQSAISEYRTTRGGKKNTFDNSLSKVSTERHISSLRSFANYLTNEGIIPANPFMEIAIEPEEDTWKISEFKAHLRDRRSSDLTIKYYVTDILAFKRWAQEILGNSFSQLGVHEIFSEQLITEYKNRLITATDLSPLSINRKLSSIRSYTSFIKLTSEFSLTNISKGNNNDQGTMLLEDLTVEEQEKEYAKNPLIKGIQKTADSYLNLEEKAAQLLASKIASKAKTLPSSYEIEKRIGQIDDVLKTVKHKDRNKEFYAPHAFSLSDKPKHKKIAHHLRHTRPNWYKKYHTYPFVHYVHFAVLIIVAAIVGTYMYYEMLGSANANDTLKALTPATKILTFNGRLLDKNNNPITTPTDVTFSVYNSPTRGIESRVWTETQEQITPAEDGRVNLVVGAATPLPADLTNSSEALYLGVKIGDSPELTPRKPLGAAFASNAEMVSGMLPITETHETKNVLLALDGSGNLAIGGSSNPKFQATGGEFTVTGEVLLLATNPSSNGNVVISPDGNGKIELNKTLISRATDSSFGAPNIIEIEGGLGVSATSTHAAIMINQNASGPLIAASTGEVAKFEVNNQGIVTRGEWGGQIIGTAYGGLGASLTPVTAGEIVYSTGINKFGTLKPGTKGQCLISQGFNAPIWTGCSGFTEVNGTLAHNSGIDLIIGSDSTVSAKFAFINLGQGTPTFKIGSALGIDANGLIQAFNNRDLILGSSSTKNVLLASSGNVGIGTTSPSRTLDVNGTFGGNVELSIDGQGSREITISGKALIYDLEKNGGNSITPETTTYNITGLPEVDGTIAYLYLKVTKDSVVVPTQTVTIKINGFSIASVEADTTTTAIKHLTILRSNNTWHVQGDPGISNTAHADLAEWTEFEGEKPQPGELVSINKNGKLVKSQVAYDARLAGAISTSPNITMGLRTADTVKLALSGRIPVIVTTINGDLTSGDPVTSSIIPGVGMKPTSNSPIIGKALSSFPDKTTCKKTSSYDTIKWPEDDGTNSSQPCFEVHISSLDEKTQDTLALKYGLTSSDTIFIGKIMVLSALSWSNSSDFLASTQGLSIEENGPSVALDQPLAELMDKLSEKTYTAKVGGQVIETVSAYGKLAAGTIQTGFIGAKNAVITGTLTAYNIVGNSITATTANFESLIAGRVTTDELLSPLATIETIQTETIEPISEDVAVKLSSGSSELTILNGDGETVTSFDNSGNATFSGSLASTTLETNDASVAGTLRAGKLIAEDIEGLENQVSSFANKFLDEYEVAANIPGYQLGESLLTASVSASFGTFHHGLISLGASTFGSISAMDQVAIGTDFILSEGGINTLGRTLEIQGFRQGAISLMAGAVTIETNGRLNVSEDAIFAKNVTVAGKLIANSLSPLPGQNLSFDIQNSLLQVKGATNSAVLEVNSQGDITASGSGTFAKLNFQLVGEAIASNDLEAYATTSAGTAFLKAYRPELTIHNNKVTEHSLIYITPKNNTDNNVLFLLRQVPYASFTVGVSQLIDHDVEFNWMIVN